jgi:hypothetical protein
MMKIFKRCNVRTKWLLTAYALCFCGALYNHVKDIAEIGILPYRDAPLWLNIFWTSLTAFDFAAIVAIFLKPFLGVLFTLAIIVVDVAINFFVTMRVGEPGALWNFFFISQAFFLVFVAATASSIFRNIAKVKWSLCKKCYGATASIDSETR